MLDCAIIQRDHSRLERQASRNLTKFNNRKHRVLCLGRNNHIHQYELDVILTVYSAQVKHLSCCIQLWALQYRGRERNSGANPSKGNEGEGLGASAIPGKAKRARTAQPDDEKSEGRFYEHV